MITFLCILLIVIGVVAIVGALMTFLPSAAYSKMEESTRERKKDDALPR